MTSMTCDCHSALRGVRFAYRARAGTVAATCEGACGIAFFTEPECGIACGVASGICAMACQQDDQPMPDVAPVADSTKFCADWRQAYDEKCQAANVTCKAVPDDYCPLSN